MSLYLAICHQASNQYLVSQHLAGKLDSSKFSAQHVQLGNSRSCSGLLLITEMPLIGEKGNKKWSLEEICQ